MKQNSTRKQRIFPSSKWYAAGVAASVLFVLTLAQPAKSQTINPGVIDPTSTYAGKTYGEWSAAWWQYYMSLPTTNNPFHLEPGYPPAPLSTAQSGPVWFLGGNYLPDGTYSYTNTVPGGIALFVMVASILSDNAACPTPTAYTEAELRAMAKSIQDDATNLTCIIDGVAVSGLTNVLTTPYRVQSPAFSFTCSAVHNVLHDLFGDTCYQNNTGMPYTISPAVADGVYLMLAPLSVGSHVIHVTRDFPHEGSYHETYTYYLTVEPVAVMSNASNPGANLFLSWPQTPDTYSLETSASVSAPFWQSATNLAVVLSNGTYGVTAPITNTGQFYRLRLTP